MCTYVHMGHLHNSAGQKQCFPRQFLGNLLNKFYFTLLSFIHHSSTCSHMSIHERVGVFSVKRVLTENWWHWLRSRENWSKAKNTSLFSLGIIYLQAKAKYILPNHIISWLSTGVEKTALENTYRISVPNVLHSFL